MYVCVGIVNIFHLLVKYIENIFSILDALFVTLYLNSG